MADKMYLVITLRKEVPDRETGRAILDLVKTKLADRPDIKIAGSVNNHFDLEPETG